MAIRLMLLALALVLAPVAFAQKRPVVVEDVATLTPPDPSWNNFGRFGVAIDGDYALVSAERSVVDPGTPSGSRQEGAALLYRRSGSAWNYQGTLGPIQTFERYNYIGLAMANGVAMTIIDEPRIHERVGSTWTPAPIDAGLAPTLIGPDIEIENGRILVARNACNVEAVVLRKIEGTWRSEGVLNGNQTYCAAPGPSMDLHLGRVIIANREGPLGVEPWRAWLYRLNPDGNWFRYLDAKPAYSQKVAINWPHYATSGDRFRGAQVGAGVGDGIGEWSRFTLQPVDAYRVEYDVASELILEHVGRDLFAQDNFSVDRQAYVVQLYRVNDDAAHSNSLVATLQTRDGGSLGDQLDHSGNRIIVSSTRGYGGTNTVRIFELPANLVAPAVQVHDFESPSSGAAWQPTAGSQFTLATVGYSRVYRQTLAPTLSASFLPEVQTNQAIQAQVTLRAVDGADRWVGLATRRTDDANYYYVTLRASGSIQLRRMVNGVFSTLASANVPVTLGRKYQLRLESIGTLHKVYLDDAPVLSARDSALKSGTAGVMAYRASADYDNVILSPAPFTTINRTDTGSFDVDAWDLNRYGGFLFGLPLRQTSLDGIYTVTTGAFTEDQIVQARIRPTAFATPDTWVGLLARYQDERNHLYVTLRGSGVVSLWRRTNGAITQLATRRMPVTIGEWHTVRLEVVNNLSRVLVNGELMLSSAADPGPTSTGVDDKKGRVGMITNRGTAEYADFVAYQP